MAGVLWHSHYFQRENINMRNFQNTDVFAFGRILSKANLKEEIKTLATKEDANPESLGFDIIFALFTNCSDKAVEEEIYIFLASLFEMEIEDVKKLDPLETIEMLSKVADWEKWKGFFSLAVKSPM